MREVVRLTGLETGSAFHAHRTEVARIICSTVRVLPRCSLTLAMIALLAVAACGKKPPVLVPQTIEVVRTVTVDRPIPVKAKLPAELLAPIDLPPLFFIPPSDPSARVALDEEGLKRLLFILRMFPALRDALKAYDAAPLPGDTK